jgi:hypothetical protein
MVVHYDMTGYMGLMVDDIILLDLWSFRQMEIKELLYFGVVGTVTNWDPN